MLYISKLLLCSLILLLAACNGGNNKNYMLGGNHISKESLKSTRHGALVYYINESNNVPVSMLVNLQGSKIASNLKYKSQKISFKSYLKIDEPGLYQFSTSKSGNKVSINGRQVLGAVNLKANQIYALDFKINQNLTSDNLQILWLTPYAKTKEPIPLANLFLPSEDTFKNIADMTLLTK